MKKEMDMLVLLSSLSPTIGFIVCRTGAPIGLFHRPLPTILTASPSSEWEQLEIGRINNHMFS